MAYNKKKKLKEKAYLALLLKKIQHDYGCYGRDKKKQE